ncbi:hypothetical protein Tco_0087043 [Tanacetum coccineum]
MLSYFIRVVDPNSRLGKICLGEDVIIILSDKVEGSGDWNSPKFQDTANSGQKKAMVFYQMDTEEVSDRFVAPCFVNGLEAYDCEINLGVVENMISNEYAIKLCLEHEFKRGNKVVKKELIVALRGEIYFVKFIINSEEDDVEPRYFEDYYSEDQYAVSIKKYTAYPCLHSPKTTEDKAQYAVSRETQYAIFKVKHMLCTLSKDMGGFQPERLAQVEGDFEVEEVKYLEYE